MLQKAADDACDRYVLAEITDSRTQAADAPHRQILFSPRPAKLGTAAG